MDFDQTLTEADVARRLRDSDEKPYVASAEPDSGERNGADGEPDFPTRGLNVPQTPGTVRRPSGESARRVPFELEMDSWEPSLLSKLLASGDEPMGS